MTKDQAQDAQCWNVYRSPNLTTAKRVALQNQMDALQKACCQCPICLGQSLSTNEIIEISNLKDITFVVLGFCTKMRRKDLLQLIDRLELKDNNEFPQGKGHTIHMLKALL